MLLPFVIGILTGLLAAFLMRHSKNVRLRFVLMLAFLCVSAACGLMIDLYLFHSFSLNYLLIGMAFSATVANLVPEKELADVLKLYNPLLSLSLIAVIV
ncbi:MAG: potassium transporter, partial [Clostridiales bacterium]|nr:potassium transporter [Clostridiales bacterium]